MVVYRSRINRLSGTLQPLGELWNDAVINLQALCSSVEQHDVTPGHEIG